MNVSACLVTRGDVEMQPVLESLPAEWEVLILDNGAGELARWIRPDPDWCWQHDMSVAPAAVEDLSVYGRYAAIEYASHDLIYVQDDDVIVSDPSVICEQWEWVYLNSPSLHPGDHAICNMPQEFRHDGYTDSALVGFGAAFHRDAPRRAFERYGITTDVIPNGVDFRARDGLDPIQHAGLFFRTCDVVFTTLTPRVLVDIPKTDREMASDPNRMWKQPGHLAERTRMLDLARQVRDA